MLIDKLGQCEWRMISAQQEPEVAGHKVHEAQCAEDHRASICARILLTKIAVLII